ncbi:MAG: GNAT family N-acetyltransferase [Robiginitomaculum sp.]|nr:MAG: GNAT family N-acetyltransferase [Robiginitomaculum sp.]
MRIRNVEKHEIEALRHIAQKTFVQTFSADNTPEDMQAYEAENFTRNSIAAEFETQGSQFFFIEVDCEIIGYLKLNRGDAQTETGLVNALEIERIYILQSCLGIGAGQALYAKAQDIAQTGGFQWLWLGVWDENPRAIAFYKKNGFETFSTHDFHFGKQLQTDILMRKEISS